MEKTKTIKQRVTFSSTPQELYTILIDSKKHSDLTGDVAKISKKVGGKFSVYGGYASGKNLEIVPGKKIVQSWRASDWPKDSFSTVTFEFKPATSGTQLYFTQTDIPEPFYKDIRQGWIDFYWTPMKKYLKTSQ